MNIAQAKLQCSLWLCKNSMYVEMLYKAWFMSNVYPWVELNAYIDVALLEVEHFI